MSLRGCPKGESLGPGDEAAPATAASGVWIRLDGTPHLLAPDTSLAALLDQLGHAPVSVGTAVNGSFVARALRQDRVLQAGDEVLLFQPIVGG